MELRHLEYFVTVVEEASFTKAAARLHVAQPGVSAQIRQLERELGQELLDRSGRTVRPTQAGTAVLAHARAALASVEAARLAVDELTGLLRGRVAVGMLTACGFVDVPNILADFHRQYPQVEITLSEANSDELLESISTGHLDLAWVGLAGAPPAGIDTQVIIDEPLVAAVSLADPLATRSTIRLNALRDRALVTLPRGTGVRSCLDSACAAAGFAPRVTLEANAPNIVAQLASQGLGTAVLPASVAHACRAELHALTVTAPRLCSRIELAWRSDGHVSAAGRALIDHARAAVAASREPAA